MGELGRTRERVAPLLLDALAASLPDMRPVSPFADVAVRMKKPYTADGLTADAEDGAAVTLMDFVLADDEDIDWESQACKMLMKLKAHDLTARNNYLNLDSNVSIGILVSA